MAGHRKGGRRGGGHEDSHPDERWLLTYSDLITLLMALFMVLFSISSVNVSKFESLQRALQEAFSGRILPGGKGVIENGGSNNIKNPAASEPFSNLQPYIGGRPEEAKGKDGKAAAKQEEEGFKKLKEKVDAIAKEQGLSGRVQTRLTKDGLAIRVLTDDLLFDSGQAVPKPQSLPLLDKVGGLLAAEGKHPVVVEGHTDTVPVHGAYPSNWELSAARASGVVRAFIGAGLSPGRMTASGRAYLKPVADNATAAGRSLNRRVEVLLPRLVAVPAASPSTPSSELPG